MTEQNTDTKNKILEVARVLFADKGFEGTSVREIAKAADVNIASVNYYFSNKENLLNEILHLGYVETQNAIRGYFHNESQKLDDLLVFVYKYFKVKSHDLKTSFKIMMSSQHSHKMAAKGTEDELVGPPGGSVILQSIATEIDKELSDEDKHWALKVLFSHVIHTSLIFSCCALESSIPFTSDADIEKNIRRLCRVVLEELKRS